MRNRTIYALKATIHGSKFQVEVIHAFFRDKKTAKANKNMLPIKLELIEINPKDYTLSFSFMDRMGTPPSILAKGLSREQAEKAKESFQHIVPRAYIEVMPFDETSLFHQAFKG